MSVFDFIVLISSVTILILVIRIQVVRFIRLNRVKDFRNKVMGMCVDWCRRHSEDIYLGGEELALEWFFESGPLLEDMAFSSRPLTLEEWYEKDKIEKLLN